MATNVFLSYASDDLRIAEQIAEALKQEGLTVLYAREFSPAKSIAASVNAALAQASYLILLWSENSQGNPLFRRAWEAYLSMQGPILPVCLDSTPFPPLLQGLPWFEYPEGIVDLLRFFNEERKRARRRDMRRGPGSACEEIANPLNEASPRELRLVAIRCAGDDLQLLLDDLALGKAEEFPHLRLLAGVRGPGAVQRAAALAAALFDRWPDHVADCLASIRREDAEDDKGAL